MSNRRTQPAKSKIAKVKSEDSVPVVAVGVSPKRARADPVRTVHLQPPVFPPGRTFVAYTMTNTPALAYDVALMLDKGFEPRKWTASRLKVSTHIHVGGTALTSTRARAQDEVLYLETSRERFELRQDGVRDTFATYTLSRITESLAAALSGQDVVVPFRCSDARLWPAARCDFVRRDAAKVALVSQVDWTDLVWGEDSLRSTSTNVEIKGLRCVRFERHTNVSYIEPDEPPRKK